MMSGAPLPSSTRHLPTNDADPTPMATNRFLAFLPSHRHCHQRIKMLVFLFPRVPIIEMLLMLDASGERGLHALEKV